jgi:hypothetical protein
MSSKKYQVFPPPLVNPAEPEDASALYPVGKARNGTPRKKALQSPVDNVMILKSKSGDKYAVSKTNKYISNLGKVLGNGKTALVVEDKKDKTIVYKILKDSSMIYEELFTQQLASCINVAPKIYGVDENVIQMQRIYMLSSFPTGKQQEQLVELVARMVSIGLMHNDLHLQNIGALADGTMLLIDFGFTQSIKPIMCDILFLQVVMAQLYALIDPCNTNNITLNDGQCDTSYIVDCIYDIRGHAKDGILVKKLLEIREDTAALFNSQSCEKFP